MPSNTLPDPGIEPETHCRYHSTKSDTLVRPNSYHTLCDAIHIAGDRTAWRNIVNLKKHIQLRRLFRIVWIAHRQCLHAMRTDDVIRNEYDAGLWTLTFLPSAHFISTSGKLCTNEYYWWKPSMTYPTFFLRREKHPISSLALGEAR
ncbi:hypothetical protein SFRURICE_007367, partial [Spodoptera frugiperda]